MSLSRTTIAPAATIAALGVLAAVALASGGEEPTAAAPAPAAETDPPVEVRTQVIRRTIHKRPKATASGARASSSDDDGTLDQGPGDRPAIPVAPSAAPPASSSDHSGPGPSSGHRGDEDDHFDDHGGDDDDHFDDDHGDDDDSGHGRGRGRGRGRGGDDD